MECNRFRRRCLPLFEVCRLSRAVAVAAYGLPGNGNPVLFHSMLDTVEVLGSDEWVFRYLHLISRNASEEDGNHGLELKFCDENDPQPTSFF